MGKKKNVGLWSVVLLLFIVSIGLGFYFLMEMIYKQETALLTEESQNVQEKDLPSEKQKSDDVEGVTPDESVDITTSLDSAIETGDLQEPMPEADPCSQIERDVSDFFSYLDGKQYVQNLSLKTDTSTHINNILKKLSDKPPVHVGEERDPMIIAQNISYLVRVIGRKDIGLILKIMSNEQAAMETNLRMFYNGFMLDEPCADFQILRPSKEVLYQYACFFLNTIGGRSYLYRRSPPLRLLINYYCLLIVHESDKSGTNSSGLDVLPHIELLKQEISYYPSFQFQQEYIDRLAEIYNYYLKQRHLKINDEVGLKMWN